MANANFTRTQAENRHAQQQIANEVKAAYEATEQRRRLAQDYKREVGEKNIELTRVARIAYQEGEHRILELLDAFRVTLNLRAAGVGARRGCQACRNRNWNAR